MPMYALKCQCCDHRFEEFGWAAERYQIRCPKCSADHCDTDFQGVRPKTARRFAGTESVSRCQGFRPQEVRRARKLMPDFQHCIRDNGDVVFSDRREERAFVRAQDSAFGVDHSTASPVPQGIWGGT